MNDYYNSIDIYVCASDNEGSPDPVLESMACGVPVISTDVGIVPEVFGKLQQNYILPERTIEQLKIKLRELAANYQIRGGLSQENLKSISNRSWEKQSVKWDTFFKSILSVSLNSDFQKWRNASRNQALELYLRAESLGSAQIEAERLQAELNNSHHRISELDKWTIELQTRIIELEKWTEDLQFNLSQVTEKNIAAHADIEKLKRELKTAYFETETARQETKTAQLEIENARQEIENARQETEVARLETLTAKQTISLMEESKFWKLRNQWFKVKEILPVNKKKT
jgi:predicted  nucleic acid-binding Zn-ribbon protein